LPNEPSSNVRDRVEAPTRGVYAVDTQSRLVPTREIGDVSYRIAAGLADLFRNSLTTGIQIQDCDRGAILCKEACAKLANSRRTPSYNDVLVLEIDESVH
jgi:hypothetical protein